MIYIVLLLILCLFTITFFIINKIYIKTSTMGAVMALGIITQGVLLNFFGPHFFHDAFGKILSVIALALWGSFSFSLIMSLFNRRFKEIHYQNPINRFAIGTWVAGTSICAILFYKQFGDWMFIAKILLYCNIILWLFYIGICIRAYYDLYHQHLVKKTHGILLLTTVSTQSLVLLMTTVYEDAAAEITPVFIAAGICLYIISGIFILKRYCTKHRSWSIAADWNNTNCILHGALSITGLACVVSGSVSDYSINILWVCAAAVFVTVESIEIYRLFKRIQAYGWHSGIFIYDVSQWSRLFTFGMFYTFTFSIVPLFPLIADMQKLINRTGIWAVLLLFMIEFSLCIRHLLQSYRKGEGVFESVIKPAGEWQNNRGM